MKKLLPVLFLLPLSLFAQTPHLMFYACPSAVEEVPVVNSAGAGLLTILYHPDRSIVTVSGMILNLEGDITSAYLIKGKKGTNGQPGDTLLNLMPAISGRRVAGDLLVSPELLTNLLADRVYAQIRTSAHPDGEIRGQFIGETDFDFKGILTGSGVTPATNSPGIALGGFHFPTASDEINYAFVFRDLSGPVTSAAIYEGQPGESGTFISDLPTVIGNFLINGLLELDLLPADFLQKCRDGKYYVLVKTAAFPDGEIRGQITFPGYFTSFAPINAVQQVPAASSPGFGMAHTVPNATLDSLHTTLLIFGIQPIAVQIRMALPGMTGPLFLEIDSTNTPGLYNKSYPVSAAELSNFIEGRYYYEVTTAQHPNGEIRGQVKNSLRKGYAFDLCGSQMVPPNASTALGMCMASIDQANCYINYKIIVDGLSSTPTDGYIRQGPSGMNGNILYPMANTTPFILGAHPVMAGQGILIEDGNAYMEIYSADFPNGEIRGQIRRGLSCPLLVAANMPEELNSVNVFPNPVKDMLYIQLENNAAYEAQFTLSNVLGQVVVQQNLSLETGDQQIEIPVGGLPPGVYQLSLQQAGKARVYWLKTIVK